MSERDPEASGGEEDEESEEMTAAERDLADDAQWKLIQKNTFTRWANEHLKSANKTIADLESDLGDGLRLVSLIEVLSSTKFTKINKRPNFRTQKLENVTMVLEFLERDEGIRIVNIDSTHIVDKNLKLILGLIWTLILHYSISMPMWEGEEATPTDKGPSPKQRLLNWIQSKVPDHPINNFTKDWSDGRAIGALVDALAPGLCPDWEDWNPKKAKQNAKEAMDNAEEWLGVPQLIKPEELTNPKVDEMSMMTYLSQFPHAKVKPGAPLRPKLNAGRVRAWGPGLEATGNHKGSPATFTVETFSAGKGTLDIIVVNPRGQPEKCDVVFNNDRNQTYSCTYVPAMEGTYKVLIKFGGKEIPKSPYTVAVEGQVGEAGKVKAYGPGLERTGNQVKKKTYFEVDTTDAGNGEVEVVILDPQGHKDTVVPDLNKKDNFTYSVEYTPVQPGLHSVNVFFAGSNIPNSPFGVGIAPASDAKKCYATGRGLQPKGVRINDDADFKVFTKGAGDGQLKIVVQGPGGREEKCRIKEGDDGVYECLYVPTQLGVYTITITFGGQPIQRSPFKVEVGAFKQSNVVAYGPGLTHGVVGQPALFTVETNGESGALGFSIEGPSQAKIDCVDNNDGSADVTYYPTAPGEYAVHILCDEVDIPKSPYMADILPADNTFDASKVKAFGPGLEKTGVIVGKPADFTVDARQAGKAQVAVTCFDADHHVVEVYIEDCKNGTFSCRYTAKKATKHTITITYGNVNITDSPFRVQVSEPAKPDKVKVYGPGVEKGVKTFTPTHFIVDCTQAGPGDVAISLTDERGRDVPVETTDNTDGTFTVAYEPQTAGVYNVNIYFADKEIPQSPIKVTVEPSIDLSQVKVEGLEPKLKAGHPHEIRVFPPPSPVKPTIKLLITAPSGNKAEIPVDDIPKGVAAKFVLDEPGKYVASILVGRQEVPQTPFPFEVISPVEEGITPESVQKVRSAPGLEDFPVDDGEVRVDGLEPKIKVGQPHEINIVVLKGPKKDAKCFLTNPANQTAEIPLNQSPQGYVTTFALDHPGKYVIIVIYGGKEAPKTPFTFEAVIGDVGPNVKVEGLLPKIPLNKPHTIKIIVGPGVQKGPCKVFLTSPDGKRSEVPTKPSPDGATSTFTLDKPGVYTLNVVYDGVEVPQTPYKLEGVPESDLGKVRIEGLKPKIAVSVSHEIKLFTPVGVPKQAAQVYLKSPDGKVVEIRVKLVPEGYICSFIVEVPGKYVISVIYGGSEVPETPFPFDAVVGTSADKVKVEGLKPTLATSVPHQIRIITPKDEPKKEAKVMLTNPNGQTVKIPTTPTDTGYACTFAPGVPGKHTINVKYDGKEVPQTPFTFDAVAPVDIDRVKVEGLKPKMSVNSPQEIRVIVPDTIQKADAQVYLTSPDGNTKELPKTSTPKGYSSPFTLDEPGEHVVNVVYADTEVPQTPYTVDAVSETDVDAVKIEGLKPKMAVGVIHPIRILTPKQQPKKPTKLALTLPNGQVKDIPVKSTPEGYEAPLLLEQPGKHVVDVKYDSKQTPQTPFTVDAIPASPADKVKVLGLEPKISAKKPHEVQIITPKDTPKAKAKITITSPNKQTAKIPTTDTPQGYATTFALDEPGKYTIHIEYDDQEVPQTPYVFEVVPETDAANVKVEGLKPQMAVGIPHDIRILTPTDEPKKKAKVTLTTPTGQKKVIPVKPTSKGYTSPLTLDKVGKHTIDVTYDDKPAPETPYTFDAVPATPADKVKVVGLEPKITAKTPHEVQIITPKDSPKKKANMTITSPDKQTAPIPVTENPLGYATTFALDEPGEYVVDIDYDGKEVPQTPYTFDVIPASEVGNVKVEGLKPKMAVGISHDIRILTPKDEPKKKATVSLTTPTGEKKEIPVKPTSKGYTAPINLDKIGKHTIDVKYDDLPAPETPYSFDAVPATPADKVKVIGLEPKIAAQTPHEVQIITPKDTPKMNANMVISSPNGQKAPIPLVESPQGYATTFALDEPGEYTVDIAYDGKEVPQTPFTFDVVPDTELGKVKVEGLKPKMAVDVPHDIRIITPIDEPKKKAKVTLTSPVGKTTDIPLKTTPIGYEAPIKLDKIGKYTVDVKYDDKEAPQMPYTFDAVPARPVDKVKVVGLEPKIALDKPHKVQIITPKDAPKAPVKMMITSPNNETAEIPTIETPQGYATAFALEQPGDYTVNVLYDNEEVPQTPYTFEAVPETELSKVKVEGLKPTMAVGMPQEVRIFTPKDEPKLNANVVITSPLGQTANIPVMDMPNGYKSIFAIDEPGKYKISVKYDGKEAPETPYFSEVFILPAIIAFYFISRYKSIFAIDEPGKYKISVKYDGKEAPETPYFFEAVPKKDVDKVRVEGLEPKIATKQPHEVKVVCPPGVPKAKSQVTITSPDGQVADIPTVETQDASSCKFSLDEPGDYTLGVKYGGKEVPQTPYTFEAVPVEELDNVLIDGLQPTMTIGEPHEITMKNPVNEDEVSPKFRPKVQLKNPDLSKKQLPTKPVENGFATPVQIDEIGPHEIDVGYGTPDVPQAPYIIEAVSPDFNPNNVKVEGLEPTIKVHEPQTVKIITKDAGQALPKATVIAPTGQTAELPTTKTPDGYETQFALEEPGDYVLDVKYGGQEVPQSPIYFEAIPEKPTTTDASKIKVYGTGLTGGEPNKPAEFRVDFTEAGPGNLAITVEGPSEPKIDYKDNQDGTCDVKYVAPVEGDYKINVTYADEHVPGSPFLSKIAPKALDVSGITASGPGLTDEVFIGSPSEFTVDATPVTRTGAGELKAIITNPSNAKYLGHVKNKEDGTYDVSYTPMEAGPHEIDVTYENLPIPEVPFKVNAVEGHDASMVKAYGPGLEKIYTNEPAEFTVSTKGAGLGQLGLAIEGPSEAKISCVDNNDGTCLVKYEPQKPGNYEVVIKFSDENIPGSPFIVPCKNPVNENMVKCYGPALEEPVREGIPATFTVDTTQAGDAPLDVTFTDDNGIQKPVDLVPVSEGIFAATYKPTEEGPGKVDVKFDGKPVPNSPFYTDVQPRFDPSKVKVDGPGVDGQSIPASYPTSFTIDVREAGIADLEVMIQGPDGVLVRPTIKDNGDGTYTVTYTPTDKGPYAVVVKFGGKDVPGSPFRVNTHPVGDASRCKISDDLGSHIPVNRETVIKVDASEAGKGCVTCQLVSPDGLDIDIDIVDNRDGTFTIMFTPQSPGTYMISIKFGGEPVPDGEREVQAVPQDEYDAIKQEELLAAEKSSSDSSSSSSSSSDEEEKEKVEEVEEMMILPKSQSHQETEPDFLDYQYPAGYLDNFPDNTEGSGAIRTPIAEEELVLPQSQTRQENEPDFPGQYPDAIDAREDLISPQRQQGVHQGAPGSDLYNPVQLLQAGEDLISPQRQQGVHQGAPGSDLYNPVQLLQAGEDLISPQRQQGVHQGAPGSDLYNPVGFRIPVGPIFNFVSATVVMPSGNRAYPTIEDNKDGTITVRYQPTEMGLHELHVMYNQEHIDGSPFEFHVDSVDSGYVTAYGPGLSHGICGEEAEFMINTKEAGAGGLSMAIEGPSKAEIDCIKNEDGTCKVTYFPSVPGEYTILIKFNDKHIMGSPFHSRITGQRHRKKSVASVGGLTEVSLKVIESDISNLTASICSPSGNEQPCILKKLPNGHLAISFTPRELGEHLVSVYREGQHIANSPFKVKIGDGEIGNATRVKAFGPGLDEGMANVVNEFTVDTSEAGYGGLSLSIEGPSIVQRSGYGGLSLSIEGPSKADIECNDNDDGTCKVTYKPTEPGMYTVNVKFADEHVPGSPYSVRIGGEPTAKIMEKITHQSEAADVTKIGSKCELSLKIPGTDPFDMTAMVASPSGVTEMCDIMTLDDNRYSIKFVPTEMGVHTVSVKHKDLHIPGSPFEFTVGPISGGGSHKVRAAGPGLVKGEIEQPCDFNIYTREAGAGALSIAVEGPSKAEVEFEDRKDGSCGVSYKVAEPGEYIVSIKFNSEHIPDSPFRVPVSPSIGDARKLRVSALQDKGLHVGRPTAFKVLFNGAKGNLTAKVVPPSGIEDDALIQEIDDVTGEYAIRFIPRENGVHFVHVFFNGHHINGSPFRVMVGHKDADPACVKAYGDGLSHGKTDNQCKFFVSTTEAGSGALAVMAEGPSKVALECVEKDEGYEFTYTPTAPGDYFITIRYAGLNIAGSPFKAKIEGSGKASGLSEQSRVVVETVTKTSTMTKFKGIKKCESDASLCSASGPGLLKAYHGKGANFNVDTTNAGNNILYIGMMGPQGPCDELHVKRTAHTTYNISYTAKAPGGYMLIVKWGDENIPGSPFKVDVL